MSYTPRRLEVSAEKIINAIKTRPPLYNRSNPNYYTMNRYKGKLWKEVCREIFENWDQLKTHQKVEYDYDLRKRWKNLRTAFAREVALQKKEKDEGNVRLRKVYAYYDQMSFLINPDIVKVTDPETIQNAPSLTEESDESRDFRVEVDDGDDVVIKPEEVEIEGNYDAEEEIGEELVTRKTTNFQEKILGALGDLKSNEDDEDRQFMMSLVPSLRKLSAKQKFTAKIAILNVLKDVMFQNE